MDSPGDHISSALMRLGLTQAQARAYVAVLTLGRGSAAEIAKCCRSTDVSTTRRRMKELMKMHLIKAELGRPNVFSVINPEVALDELLSRAKAEMASKMKMVEELQKEIIRFHKNVPEMPSTVRRSFSYHLVRGRNQFLKESCKFCRQAKRESLLILPPRAINVIPRIAIDDFKACISRGVAIQIITEICDANLKDAQRLSQLCQIRNHKFVPVEMHIWDRKTTCFGAVKELAGGPDHTDDPYLVIEDPSFAEAMALFFGALWEDSHELNLDRGVRALLGALPLQ